MLIIKKLNYDDVENVSLLQENIMTSYNDNSLFYPATSDELKLIIKYTGYAIGLYSDQKLIGYATIIFCSKDNELTRIYNIPTEYIPTTAILDDVAILAQYRGHKYQLLLWNYIASQFSLGIKYIITSIHPQNIASLKNAYSFGMTVIAQKRMYNNSLRHILLKKL